MENIINEKVSTKKTKHAAQASKILFLAFSRFLAKTTIVKFGFLILSIMGHLDRLIDNPLKRFIWHDYDQDNNEQTAKISKQNIQSQFTKFVFGLQAFTKFRAKSTTVKFDSNFPLKRFTRRDHVQDSLKRDQKLCYCFLKFYFYILLAFDRGSTCVNVG